MKKLACQELDPSSDCHFVAEGMTNEEVIGKIMAHAKADHPDKVASMSEAEMQGMQEKMTQILEAQA